MRLIWPLTCGWVALAACGSGGGGSGGVAPTVLSVTPASGATAVALTSTVVVTFSESMDCSTITSATYGVTTGGMGAPGQILCFGATATFAANVPFSPATTYLATVSTGANDASGTALAAAYSWSFTTVAH